MPNNILKSHVKPLEDRIDEIAATLKMNTNLYYNTRTIELFYSTPEQLEIADECLEWCGRSQIARRNPKVTVAVELEHPNVPHPKMMDVVLEIDHVFGQPTTLWPASMQYLRDDFDMEQMDDFLTRVRWMVQQRIGIALLRKVMAELLLSCNTYEQIRWNFPPIIGILRGMDKEFRNIASDIETNKGRVNAGILDVEERRRIRYVTEFWATHELLDTFHKGNNPPAGTHHVDASNMTLMFGDNYSVVIK